MPHSLFISDLHLCPTRPAINALFMRFVQDIAPQAEALYILGDFFEYWAGDDDLADPFHLTITNALAGLAKQGTRVYIMHGNRDFLLSDAFMRAAQATLLPDPFLLDLYGTPTLLMHGDTLCTDDVAYQQFRIMVRSAEWQRNFLTQPLNQRKAQIDELRKRSAQEKSNKSAEIMDVNADAVASILRAQGYPRLIHGHTHRPARHVHTVDGKDCVRWVLADWYATGSYLRCDTTGCVAHAMEKTPKPKHY
ncbi:MAG: UDP-2,3-diacylglucosamine diphosphatase [Burkholderiales bacterium]|nr:UDP-2,3-diacylglucosamine diphosphatase [Burkholderiales bacterium]